jgi:hypothetical protein
MRLPVASSLRHFGGFLVKLANGSCWPCGVGHFFHRSWHSKLDVRSGERRGPAVRRYLPFAKHKEIDPTSRKGSMPAPVQFRDSFIAKSRKRTFAGINQTLTMAVKGAAQAVAALTSQARALFLRFALAQSASCQREIYCLHELSDQEWLGEVAKKT